MHEFYKPEQGKPLQKAPKPKNQREQTLEEALEPKINIDPKEFRDGQVYLVRDILKENQHNLENANPQNDGELTQNALLREQNQHMLDNANAYVGEPEIEREEKPTKEFQT